MRRILLTMLVAIFSVGCASIDHRTTGSPVMNIEWSIAPIMSVEEEALIPTTDKAEKDKYLSKLQKKNGGFWLVNSWIVGALTPSITMVTEYWCDSGMWPYPKKCDVQQRYAAGEGGWVKAFGTAVIIGGAGVGAAAVLRPDQTNINQSGGGASASGGNAKAGAKANAKAKASATSKSYHKLDIHPKYKSPGWSK